MPVRAKKREVKACIACDNTKFAPYGKDVVECSKCKMVVASEIPTFDQLKKLYEEEYFFGMEYSDYIADRKALEKNFKKRVKFLSNYINKDSKVVEVGCAYGYFLNLIKDSVAWHKGYDVSKEGIEYAKNQLGVNAVTDDFLKDSTVKSGTLDLICMWDVMEHFGEPQKHVAKASKLLKKGGVLSFTTGDVGAFVAQKRGDKWRMVHPPTHVYYFNIESSTKLLAKHGLEITSVRHKATYRNAGSVFNQLIANNKSKNKNTKFLDSCFSLAKLLKLDRINFPLNLYDVMEVTATKI